MNAFNQHAAKAVRYKYQTHPAQVTDVAMTVVLTGIEIKRQLTHAAYLKVPALNMVVKLVATGEIKVPTEPLPFHDVAQQLCNWSNVSQ
jgi:hypothetical protein